MKVFLNGCAPFVYAYEEANKAVTNERDVSDVLVKLQQLPATPLLNRTAGTNGGLDLAGVEAAKRGIYKTVSSLPL